MLRVSDRGGSQGIRGRKGTGHLLLGGRGGGERGGALLQKKGGGGRKCFSHTEGAQEVLR